MFTHTLFSNAKWNKVAFRVLLAKTGRVFMLLVFLLSMVGGSVISVHALTTTFTGGELLGKPTDTSITINIVPDSTIEYYYEYGTTSGVYTDQTSPVTATGGQPHEVTITELSPNTRYYYRMVYDADGDVSNGFEVRSEHTFQTQRDGGESFVFTVTSDSHGNFGTNTATHILNGSPDFNVDIGDTFMVDTLAETQSAYNGRYEQWRGSSYFGGIGQSVPVYLAMGNHEEEEGWNLDDTPSRAVLNIEARKLYFPMPTDGEFYTGNTDTLALLGGDQLREDYYAWEWGDALFVVIDPFQYTMNLPYTPIAGEESDETIDGDQWSWTLGDQQYNWLKQTLTGSDAKYKFVFSHNMVGGVTTAGVSGGPGYVRGGAGGAPYFEWGGYNADGSWGFATERPGWDKPIHQLFIENGVSAYFHGHDHQYVYETRDGVVYQEVPSTSMTGSGFGGIYSEGTHTDFYGEYNTVEMLSSGGHLRISITPTVATVDYIAASGGGVNYSYDILPSEVTEPDFTIAASAGANGSISPSGEVGVVAGADQSFTIIPNSSYQVEDVLVDGASEGAITGYTFTDIQANHTIAASFVAAPPTGEVTVDGVASSNTADAGSSSITIADHTTGTGVNGLMLVGVSWNCGTTDRSIDSVTFTPDGEDPIELDEVITQQGVNSSSDPRYSAIYSLLNPPIGVDGSVTIDFSGSVGNGIIAGVANFAGVDQTTPFETPDGASETSGSAPTITLTGLDGDELVFDNVFQGASGETQTLTAGADQAQRWNAWVSNTRAAASIEQATGGSVTMSWTAGSSSVWAISAVPINPAPFSGITYELTMAGDGNGTTSPSVGTHTYPENSVVSISAIPSAGYIFDSWTGNADCEDGSVTMNADKACTATFVEVPPGVIAYLGDIGSATTKTTGASLTVTTDQAVSAGNTIIVGYVTDPAQNLVATVSDSVGNTYEQAALAVNWANGRSYIFYAYAENPLPAGSTITITGDQEVDAKAAVVSVFSGIAQNGLDQFLGNPDIADQTTESGTTPMVGPTSTTAQADELLIGVIGTQGPVGDNTGTWGNSFTAGPRTGTSGDADDTNWTVSLGYRIVSSTGQYTAQKSGVTDRLWAATIATFKGGDGTGGGTVPSNTILLGRPTGDSVTVSAILEQSGEVLFEYGDVSGNYVNQTSTLTATADSPVEVVIDGLTSNTQYFYRMLYRATSTGDWIAGDEHTFHTQRDSGETFTFTIISDSHLGDTFSGNNPARYEQTTLNVAADHPDFHLDLGDTFVMNSPTNQNEANAIYLAQRPYFGNFSHSAPVFLAIGNHENEEGWNLDDTPFSKALASINARKQYFLNPVSDGFYSGNDDPLPEISGDHLREDYYAWEWGDALFVVLDPFQYTMVKPYTADPFNENETETGDQWEWTLGLEQFLWFKDTLENSNANYKFVFAHHMVGGMPNLSAGGADAGYVRLGAEAASYFEWGGLNGNGTQGFGTERPEAEWGSDPIHQLMVNNGVSAFFHGHDHQYVHEERDGIVYQLVPSASMGSGDYGFDLYDDSPYAVSGGNLPNAGHLRVTVSPDETTVEYVRSAISGDTGVTNGQINHPYTILPAATTTYDLDIAVEPANGGSTDPGVGAHTYDLGSVVDITATPASGYVFDHWSGDCSGSGACQVTMDDDMSVTAHFTQIMHNLTVVANPVAGGTTNPAAGVHSYAQGTVMSVTATPASGYAFDHWSGACTGSGACQVTMNTDLSVTAHFVQVTHNLTVAVDPAAGGTTNPTVGVHSYAEGIVVTVTATPASGYVFDHWSGACSGTGACQVTMSADISVTAHFTQITHDLSILVDPITSGTTNPIVGVHSYVDGSVVSITATPSSGYEFDHWSGDCSGSGACQVTMAADMSVTAHFALLPDSYNLTVVVNPGEGGTTDPGSGVHPYARGTVVDIIPTANSGFEFDQWGGACMGTGACQVTMDANKTVTAYFDPITTPSLPSSFSGEIHIYDNPPVEDDVVEAYVPGVAYAVATATITGDADNLVYVIKVPGDDGYGPKEGGVEGDPVTFMINGRIVAMGTWHGGSSSVVNIDFHPPEALPGGPYNGIAGVAIDFAGSANDWGTDALTYEWDWDNDGTYDESGQNPSHTWANVGNYTIGLKVTDAQGGVGKATVEVVVDITTHSIALEAGWNLVSFNVHPLDTSPAAVLSSIAGNYSLVFVWDGTKAGDNWLKHDPNLGYGDTLLALDEGMGFWIYMTAADILEVTGTMPETTSIELSTNGGGWNMVGYPSSVNEGLPEALSDHGVNTTDFSLMYSYHPAEVGDEWKLFDPNAAPYVNNMTELAPGWGYWIYATADSTWNVAYSAP